MAPAWQFLFCCQRAIFCWLSEFSFFLCVLYCNICTNILIIAAHYNCSAEWSARVCWRCAADRGPCAYTWSTEAHTHTTTYTLRGRLSATAELRAAYPSCIFTSAHTLSKMPTLGLEKLKHTHTQKHRRTCRHTPSDTTGQAQPTTVAATEHKQLSHTQWIIWAFQYCFR